MPLMHPTPAGLHTAAKQSQALVQKLSGAQSPALTCRPEKKAIENNVIGYHGVMCSGKNASVEWLLVKNGKAIKVTVCFAGVCFSDTESLSRPRTAPSGTTA